MEDFIKALLDDLKSELSVTDENFDETILEVKIKGALREVLQELGYSGVTLDDTVYTESGVDRYYMNIRNIALYDYNLIGGEFSSSINESSTTRHFTDRNKLFAGIYPKAKVN